MKRYEQLPHTADLAAKIYGHNIQELFENAAFAMFDMMADLGGIKAQETVKIDVKGPDTESLLVSWLNEILYAAYIKKMLFTEFRVLSLEDNKLSAEAKGGRIKEGAGPVRHEIKAATYHDLEIKESDGECEVTIVFDV